MSPSRSREVVPPDRAQAAGDLGRIEDRGDPVGPGMPLGDHLIDQAALAQLILELPMLVAPVLVVDVAAHQPARPAGPAVRLQHGTIRQLDALHEICAVEQVVVDPAPAAIRHAAPLGGGMVLAQCLGHRCAGFQRAEIEPAEPGVRPEQLHVQRVMLAAPQHAGAPWIPLIGVVRMPGIFDRPLHPWPKPTQPGIVAAQLPVAIKLHHIAELPIGTGAFGGQFGADREAETEAHPTRGVHVVYIVRCAHRAFECGIQERQRLLVVPDMGAASLAGPGGGMAAFEAIERAIGQPDCGRNS